MKTYADVKAARRRINERVVTPGLSEQQKMMLMGVSIALQWVCEEGGTTVERLLGDEPMEPGKTRPLPDFSKGPEARTPTTTEH